MAIRYVCRVDISDIKPRGLRMLYRGIVTRLFVGKRFGWQGVDVFHFDADGKIKEKYTYSWYGSNIPHLQPELGWPRLVNVPNTYKAVEDGSANSPRFFATHITADYRIGFTSLSYPQWSSIYDFVVTRSRGKGKGIMVSCSFRGCSIDFICSQKCRWSGFSRHCAIFPFS